MIILILSITILVYLIVEKQNQPGHPTKELRGRPGSFVTNSEADAQHRAGDRGDNTEENLARDQEATSEGPKPSHCLRS
jgi:hypothetical protein